MALQVVGAGVGRTGTHSLKLALERLLGGPCHHMIEVFGHLEEQVPVFHAATREEPVDWHALFDGYAAMVDWPGGAFWREISDAFPDALVLLSVRESAEAWWRSADRTILEPMREGDPPPEMRPWATMMRDLLTARFTNRIDDKQALIDAYERHNAAVRAGVPADRLLEWQPTDGWAPICERLGLDVPDEPFPVTNTTGEFRAMLGLEP